MITKVILKKPMHFGDQRLSVFEADKGYGLAVQSGLVVIRHPRTGETKSRPLGEVLEFDGCPAAPPTLKGRAE